MKISASTQKKISATRIWLGILLVLLALTMSFLPVITLETKENAKAMTKILSEIGIADPALPERVEITAIDLLKSADLMIDIATLSVGDGEAKAARAEKIRGYVATEKGEEALVTSLALMATLGDSLSESAEEDIGWMALVFEVLFALAALFAVLGMAISLPITLTVKAIMALISALRHWKSPEKATPRVSGAMGGLMTMLLTLMIFQILLPGMSYGVGLMGAVAVALCAAVLNGILSHLYPYKGEERSYLILLQAVSVVGIGGFFLFFRSFLKTGVLASFLGGSYPAYLSYVAGLRAADVNNAYMFDGALFIVLLIFAFSVIEYADFCLARLSCGMSRKKDTALSKPILALIVCLIPMMLAEMKHGYHDPLSTEKEGDFSFLTLSAEGLETLHMALVGAAIMLMAEIAMKALRKALCGGLSKETRRKIASGTFTPEEEELVVEEQPIETEDPIEVEESDVEEPDTQIPAEEPTAEDTTAEAPVVEEDTSPKEISLAELLGEQENGTKTE